MFRLACLFLVALVPAQVAAAERTFVAVDFDEIRVIGPHAVTVVASRATTVRGSGNREALDALLVESRNRILTIRTAGATVSDAERQPVRITVTAPRLRAIRLNGAGAVRVAELRGTQVEASVSGGGTISVASVMADAAALKLSGSGSLSASGRVQSLDVTLRGSGSIAAPELQSSDLKLVAAGPGAVALSASRSAAVTASGAGTIAIGGRASCTIDNRGIGVVTCGPQPR